MRNTKQNIEDIKANGYNIDFGTVFNNAFENYKKIALQGGVAVLIIVILMCILCGLIAVGAVGMALTTNSLSQFRVENLSIMWLVPYIIVIILVTAIASPINAGLIKMAKCAAKAEAFSVGTAFDYYRGSYFKEIVMAAIIISLFSSMFSVGLQWLGFQLLGFVLSLSVSVLTFLTIPLIIFGNLKAMEAIEGSIIIVSKQFFILLALMIVSAFFMMLGLFGFCIGIFFTVPFMYSMYYSVYTEIMGDETPATLSEELASEENQSEFNE
ncbi:hypothetical protein [Flavobacterium sp.]|uniref:hypothetical protein n=1 Tax=Flavobacterium sp. TaxID=239 RepID=UPI002627847A|nr:hypothetical protein [Flavobacterium sp.]